VRFVWIGRGSAEVGFPVPTDEDIGPEMVAELAKFPPLSIQLSRTGTGVLRGLEWLAPAPTPCTSCFNTAKWPAPPVCPVPSYRPLGSGSSFVEWFARADHPSPTLATAGLAGRSRSNRLPSSGSRNRSKPYQPALRQARTSNTASVK